MKANLLANFLMRTSVNFEVKISTAVSLISSLDCSKSFHTKTLHSGYTMSEKLASLICGHATISSCLLIVTSYMGF